MDPVRLGRQIRALRRRRRWRQVHLGLAAGVSRTTVSRVELGRGDDLTVRTIEALARALSARLELYVSWNGEALDRLLDADHASLVEVVTATLRSLGWEVAVEVSFNIRGERGSIDVLAYHPATRVLLVVEVKSVVPDVQATLMVFDRKSRLASEIARQRGWSARATGRLLVVADRRTARRRVEAHANLFDTALPDRATAIKRWLRAPDAARPVSGLWFLSDARQAVTSQRHGRPARRPRAQPGSRC